MDGTFGSCSSYDDVEISNNEIIIDAGSDTIICNQSVMNLHATEPLNGQTGQWTIEGGNGTFLINSAHNTTG